MYLQNPVRKIRYTELKLAVLEKLSGSFNVLAFPSESNVKRMIIMPFINREANGSYVSGGNTVVGFAPLQSPFASEPNNCSPYLLQNFNVAVSGVNLYMTNQNVPSYDLFATEMNLGLNAGKEMGLSSCIISMNDYINNYGYIVCDVSRRLPQDGNSANTYYIQGTNKGLLALDLYVYVELEREISIDIFTGLRV